jgi:hypothetical protein
LHAVPAATSEPSTGTREEPRKSRKEFCIYRPWGFRGGALRAEPLGGGVADKTAVKEPAVRPVTERGLGSEGRLSAPLFFPFLLLKFKGQAGKIKKNFCGIAA